MHGRFTAPVAAFGIASLAVACATLTGLEPPEHAASPDSVLDEAGTKDGETADVASPPPQEAGVDAEAGPPCELTTENATIEADSGLPASACAGANYFGTATNINVSTQFRTVLRFALSATAEAAATSGRFYLLTLTIDENPTCDGTCGSNNNVAGDFVVAPMRTDWDEGATPFSSYQGADSCRRKAGGSPQVGWGAGAPSTRIAPVADYGDTAATIKTVAGDTKLVFAIPGSKALFAGRQPNKIGFTLAGVAGANFFGAGHESAMHAAPKLVIQYCKS